MFLKTASVKIVRNMGDGEDVLSVTHYFLKKIVLNIHQSIKYSSVLLRVMKMSLMEYRSLILYEISVP